MGFANAPAAWLSGVKVSTADIEDAAVTTDKLASPGSIAILGPCLLQSPSPAEGVLTYQACGAAEVIGIGLCAGDSGTSGTLTVDCHVGANSSTAASVFGAGEKLTLGAGNDLVPQVAAPSGALGALPDNGLLRLDLDAVPSGTLSNVAVWVVLKQEHVG